MTPAEREARKERDPRINPQPGDILSLETYQPWKREVTARNVDIVEWRVDWLGYRTTLYGWQRDNKDATIIHVAEDR